MAKRQLVLMIQIIRNRSCYICQGIDTGEKGFQGPKNISNPKGWERCNRIYAGFDDAAALAWLCPAIAQCHNPVGVELFSVPLPRVASPSFVKSTSEGRQPWALMRNPFGIEDPCKVQALCRTTP